MLQSEPRALAAAMQQAQQNELEAMTDMFNKMTEQCFRKCVALYKEEHLSVGEATCVDRCVHKYMAAHGKVQDILGKQAQQMQAMQMQAMQAQARQHAQRQQWQDDDALTLTGAGDDAGGGEDGAGRGNEQVAREAVRAAMQGRRR